MKAPDKTLFAKCHDTPKFTSSTNEKSKMRVFRGPSSVPFPDDLHELVSTTDLSKMASLKNGAVVICANVTKEPTARQALAHIELDFDDIVSLQSKLLSELLARSKELDNVRSRIEDAEKHIYDIYEAISALDEETLCEEKKQQLLDMTNAPLSCLDLGNKNYRQGAA